MTTQGGAIADGSLKSCSIELLTGCTRVRVLRTEYHVQCTHACALLRAPRGCSALALHCTVCTTYLAATKNKRINVLLWCKQYRTGEWPILIYSLHSKDRPNSLHKLGQGRVLIILLKIKMWHSRADVQVQYRDKLQPLWWNEWVCGTLLSFAMTCCHKW